MLKISLPTARVNIAVRELVLAVAVAFVVHVLTSVRALVRRRKVSRALLLVVEVLALVVGASREGVLARAAPLATNVVTDEDIAIGVLGSCSAIARCERIRFKWLVVEDNLIFHFLLSSVGCVVVTHFHTRRNRVS